MVTVIDMKNTIVGRAATHIAKRSLLGEEFALVNCEDAVITGKKSKIIADHKRKREWGVPLKGPYYPKSPERIVKRMIRGMLPYKQEKGEKALSRVKCYVGVPSKFNDLKQEKFEAASIAKLSNLNYLSIKEISKQLGARTWKLSKQAEREKKLLQEQH